MNRTAHKCLRQEDSSSIWCFTGTDLSKLPEELPITEEDHSEWKNKTSGEESDNIAVICYVG